jgi:hypothetical protein
MGAYYKDFGVRRNIKSPGNLHIFSIARDRHAIGALGETEDYRISFGSQTGALLYFGHVNTISARLTDAVAGFSTAVCNTYIAGGLTQEQCVKEVSIDVTAGEIIGTGGVVAGQYALDIGMLSNNNAVCPLDYFDAPTRAELEPKLGSYDGTIRRTEPPLCGEVNQDLAGTLRGIWLKQGLPKYPEDNHIAFVKDNVEPAKPCISIGSAVPGLASNVYTFIPQSSGQIDRRFTEVTSNGSIYCFSLQLLSGGSVPGTSIIVKLDNNTTLSFEKRNCDCASNLPYSFTTSKMVYVRQ